MAKLKNSNNIKCRESRSIPSGNTKLVQPLWNTVWQFLIKLNMQLHMTHKYALRHLS